METRDDLLFTVKGLVHPPSRIVAYLRYVPDERGSRKRGGKRYRRVYRFEEQEELLRARWPGYIIDEPMFGVRLQAVPADAVHLVRDPRSYLQHLVKRGPADALEDTALHLVSLVRRAAGIRSSALGLSGSMLLGLHTTSSDIDLVVYGELESRAVHEALGCLLQDELSPVSRPNDKELESIYEMHSVETPLSFADFARAQIRKVNEGSYAGWPYFVRFVKLPEQVADRYGNPRYESLGLATIRARVLDDAEAIFTPSSYKVGDVAVLEGVGSDNLCEIVSLRGRFADQVKAGDLVVARGHLERVMPRRIGVWSRLMVGAKLGDYLMGRPS